MVVQNKIKQIIKINVNIAVTLEKTSGDHKRQETTISNLCNSATAITHSCTSLLSTISKGLSWKYNFLFEKIIPRMQYVFLEQSAFVGWQSVSPKGEMSCKTFSPVVQQPLTVGLKPCITNRMFKKTAGSFCMDIQVWCITCAFSIDLVWLWPNYKYDLNAMLCVVMSVTCTCVDLCVLWLFLLQFY